MGDEFRRRENVREGEGEGMGFAGVLQFFRKVVELASEQQMLDSFCFLAELAESVGVAL